MAARAGRSTRAAGFPNVAVRDIVVHPRTSDLVLATHGRGIWIIDDISPWRVAHTGADGERRGVPSGVRRSSSTSRPEEAGPRATTRSTAPGRPEDAPITYYQRTRHIFGDLKIEIFDAHGNFVDTSRQQQSIAASIAPRGPCA